MPQAHNSTIWTPKRILTWTTEYLTKKGDEHPRRSAEWLLSYATGLSRVELYTHFDQPLRPDELKRMHKAVERRAEGEPLQYVTGEMAFRHVVLRCAPGVLIPRPETEMLVEYCLEVLPASKNATAAASKAGSTAADLLQPTTCNVLEIGTGTGCIALSLAEENEQVSVIATDINPQAVELARNNAATLRLSDRVQILESNLADALSESEQGSFDLLVSNPPYIPTQVLQEVVPTEVKDFEPRLALDGGVDGLDMYRALVDVAERMLKPGGYLALELFETALKPAAAYLRQRNHIKTQNRLQNQHLLPTGQTTACASWQNISIKQDLARRPRVLMAQYM